jgi:hypothetical protein
MLRRVSRVYWKIRQIKTEQRRNAKMQALRRFLAEEPDAPFAPPVDQVSDPRLRWIVDNDMVLKAQYNLYRQDDLDYEQLLIEMVVMVYQQRSHFKAMCEQSTATPKIPTTVYHRPRS